MHRSEGSHILMNLCWVIFERSPFVFKDKQPLCELDSHVNMEYSSPGEAVTTEI